MKAAGLDRLQALADLRAQRSGQVLARAQTAIADLEARADGLRAPLAPAQDIESEIARDRHGRWRTNQLRRLNLEIAGRRAHAEPLRKAHGRDRARAEVLERLRAEGPSRSGR
ncbi:MAG: hypothetical protein AAF366_05225 [Pseudomonadota bacterium]